MKDAKIGGRGQCQYCKEYYNNVSYHEAWECEGNTNLHMEILDENYISRKKVLDILEKYRHVPGAHYIKAEIEKL